VSAVSPLRTAPAEITGETTELVAVDTSVFDELYDLEVSSGSLPDVRGDGIAVSSDEGLASATPSTSASPTAPPRR
jgi:hypothetical protein